jgi:hypothetical protein
LCVIWILSLSGSCLYRGLTLSRISCGGIWNLCNINQNSTLCTFLNPSLGYFLHE